MVLRASEALKRYKKTMVLIDLAYQKRDREWFEKLTKQHNDLWMQTTVSNNYMRAENREKYNNLLGFFKKRRWA